MRKIPAPYTDPSYLFCHGGAAPPGMLDFSASINPLGPPQSVLDAIQRALPDIARYPDPECRELTARLAALHGVAPEQIVVGNGSNELIYAIARAFRPKRVAIAEPTYTEYLRASLAVGAAVDHWLAEGEHFDLQPFDPADADIVWLCNPNNPTGRLWPDARLLLNWITMHRRTIFVVDEAFMALSFPHIDGRLRPLYSSLVPATFAFDNLIVLCSLTKLFALPGIRLGYLVTKPAFAREVARHSAPWSINRLAQIAGCTALGDNDYLQRTQTVCQWEQNHCESVLRDLFGATAVLPPEANFILVRLPSGTINAPALTACLGKRGFLIRDASNFVGLNNTYIRTAVRTAADNQRLLTELRAILES